MDSAATIDLLGSEHCRQATNVQDMEVPQALGTAGDDVQVSQMGDCEVHEGMSLKGAWMAPWMNKTLISLGNRVKEGYVMIAAGTNAYLISPVHKIYKYTLSDGLYYPTTTNANQMTYVVKPRPVSNNMVIIASVLTMAIWVIDYF